MNLNPHRSVAPTNRIDAIEARSLLQVMSSLSFTCLQCQLRVYRAARLGNPSFKYPSTRRYASGFDTEKWRKRIWGPETPPALVDPYGSPGVIDQWRKEIQPEKQENGVENIRNSAETDATVSQSITDEGNAETYKPASTWKGLPRIGGHLWGKKEFTLRHPFEGHDNLQCGSR